MKNRKEIEGRIEDLNNAITLSDKDIVKLTRCKKIRYVREIELLLWVLK